MFARFLTAVVLSTVVMFLWGFIVWAISPVPAEFVHAAPDGEALGKHLKEKLPESGVYFLPFPDGKNMEELERLHQEGPIVQLNIVREGREVADPQTMIMGVAHNFVSALLMACLLKAAVGSLNGFTARFGFVVLAGIFAAVYTHGIDLVWFYEATDFSLFRMGYNISTWVLVAPIMAGLIWNKKAESEKGA